MNANNEQIHEGHNSNYFNQNPDGRAGPDEEANTFDMLQQARPRKSMNDFISPRFPSNQKQDTLPINQANENNSRRPDEEMDFTQACNQVNQQIYVNDANGLNEQQSNQKTEPNSPNQANQQIFNPYDEQVLQQSIPYVNTPPKNEVESNDPPRFSFGKHTEDFRSNSLRRRSTKDVNDNQNQQEDQLVVSNMRQMENNEEDIQEDNLLGFGYSQQQISMISTIKNNQETNQIQSQGDKTSLVEEEQFIQLSQLRNHPQNSFGEEGVNQAQDNQLTTQLNNRRENESQSQNGLSHVEELVTNNFETQIPTRNLNRSPLIHVSEEGECSMQAIDNNQGQIKMTPRQNEESQRGFIRLTTAQSRDSLNESRTTQAQIEQNNGTQSAAANAALNQQNYIRQANRIESQGGQRIKQTQIQNIQVNSTVSPSVSKDQKSSEIKKESQMNLSQNDSDMIEDLSLEDEDSEEISDIHDLTTNKDGFKNTLGKRAKKKAKFADSNQYSKYASASQQIKIPKHFNESLIFKKSQTYYGKLKNTIMELGYDPELNSGQTPGNEESKIQEQIRLLNYGMEIQKYTERRHRQYLEFQQQQEEDRQQQQKAEQTRDKDNSGSKNEFGTHMRREGQQIGLMSRELFDQLLHEFEPTCQVEEEEEEVEPQKRYPSLKNVCAIRYQISKEKSNHQGNQQTQVLSQLLQEGSGRSPNQIKKMLKDNPNWINNLMSTNPQLGLLITQLYRCLTCRCCSRFLAANRIAVGEDSEDQNQFDVIEQDIDDSHYNSQDDDDEERQRREEWKLMIERDKILRQKYCQQSLGHFDLDHPFRLFFIKIVENPYFDKFVLFLIVINSLFLGIMDYTWTGEGKMPLGNQISESSEIFFTIFFTFECFSKIIAMGMVFHKKCYLRDGWNGLDFIVVVTGLINNLPGMSNVSSLRTFRLFRPLRSLSQFPSMRMLITTLFISFQQLGNILILDIFFILTFSLFGLQMWGGIIHYRCRKTPHPVNGDWEIVEDDTRICGSFHQCAPGSYCGSLFETTLPGPDGIMREYALNDEVKNNLWRDSMIKELNYGITNFDTIASSYLTMFQCTTLEGWTKIMQMMQDGYSLFFSTIFFMALVIVCSYFLLNLTVAVMLDNFKQLNDTETAVFIEKYENNRHRIKQLKSLDAALGRLKFLQSNQSKGVIFKNFCRNHCFRHPGSPQKKSDKSKVNRYDYKICLYSWMIIKQPIFGHFIMLLIIFNTVILACDSYPESDQLLSQDSAYIFTILFTIESVLKLLGLTRYKFRKDKFNIFDLVIVLVSILEMIMPQSNLGIITSLRAFRLARLFKLARSNHTLKCLLDSIAQTISAIANFIVLLLLFIYVFALLGMTMFAGKFKFNNQGYHDPENGHVPRMNFDSLDWAIITVFQIMVGDQWQEVMYLAIESNGSISVLFFVSLVLFGNFIMLNLFLAILLGNFEISSLVIRSEYEDQILKNFEKQLVWHNQQLLNEKDISNDESDDLFDSDDSEQKQDTAKELRRLEKIEQINKDYQMFLEHEKQNNNDLTAVQRNNEDISKQFDLFRKHNTQKKLEEDPGDDEKQDEDNQENDKTQNEKPQKLGIFSSPLQTGDPGEGQKTPQTQVKMDSADVFMSQEPAISPGVRQEAQSKNQAQSKILEQLGQLKRITQFQTDIAESEPGNEPQEQKAPNQKIEKARKSVTFQNFQFMQDDQNHEPKFKELKRPTPLKPVKGNFSFSLHQNKQSQSPWQETEDKVETIKDQLPMQEEEQCNKLINNFQEKTPAESLASSVLSQAQQKLPDQAPFMSSTKEMAPNDPALNQTKGKAAQPNRQTNIDSQLKESSYDSSIEITDVIQQKLSQVRSSYQPNAPSAHPLFKTHMNQPHATPFSVASDVDNQENSNENPDDCKDADCLNSERSNIDGDQMQTSRPLQEDVNTEPSLQKQIMTELEQKRLKMNQFFSNVYQYMSESSLFILHKDTAIRKFLIRLTIKKVRKKRKNLFEKDKMIQKINGGFDGEDSEELNDECKQNESMHANAQDPSVDKHFGMATWTGESFEEYQEKNQTKEAQQQNEILNPIRPKDHDQQDEDTDESQSEYEFSTEEVTEAFKYKFNKRLVKDRMNFIVKRGGMEHDLEKIIENEFQKKYNNIQHFKHQCTLNRRPGLKMQKILERDYEDIMNSLTDYQKRLQFFNKMRYHKQALEKQCPFMLWSLNTWFENFIYFFILLAMLLLVIDNPNVDPDGSLRQWMLYLENIIILVFFIEAILRILANGFIHSSLPGKKGYITKAQNQIDFTVSILVDLLIQGRNMFPLLDPKYNEVLRSFKVLRCLRTLRTLRMIARTEALRLAINSLFGALPAIGNAIIVCSLILCIYAILGISIFKGKFYYCSLDSTPYSEKEVKRILETVNTKDDCIRAGGTWLNSDQNFDTIWNALPLLCEIITTEGWLSVMYKAVDSRGIDQQPKENHSSFAAIFFVSFIIIGNIFILNLFVGVVIDKFNRLRDKMFGYLLMTRDQRLWIEKDKQMIRIKVVPQQEPPADRKKMFAYNICNHRNFDIFINFCIYLNVVLMALRYYTMNATYLRTLHVIGNILTVVYNIEAIIKIVAYDFSYFQVVWNQFDFFIVIIADLAFLGELGALKENQFFKFLFVLKSLRIIRIFRVIRVYHNMMILTDSLVIIMPCVINIGSLILLLFFIFGVIGNNLFSNVIHQTEINENNNFETFLMSLIVLMRCTTGEGWNKIMRELAITKDKPIYKKNHLTGHVEVEYCVLYQTYEHFKTNGPKECGNLGSFIFFGVFIVTIQMMMLNLFIAVVIEGFSSTNKEHTGTVTQKDYQDFINKWLEFDPDATGWINLENLIFLMHKVDPPLGFIDEIQGEKHFDDIMRTIMRTMKKNSQLIDFKSKFIVDQKHNLIISQKKARAILDFLRLPVYKSELPLNYKCHIAHVLKRLTFIAFKKANPNFDPYGIEMRHLNEHQRQWNFNYPDLVKEQPVERYDCGRIWSILFIVSNVKKIVNQKKLMDQEVAYNFNAKEMRNQQAKVAQKRLDDANKKLIDQRKKQLEIKRLEEESKKDKQNNKGSNDLNDRKETKGSSDEEKKATTSNNGNKQKLSKQQLRQQQLQKCLEKEREKKENERFQHWLQDQAFEKYLDSILEQGPLFKQFKIKEREQQQKKYLDDNKFKRLNNKIFASVGEGIKQQFEKIQSQKTIKKLVDEEMNQSKIEEQTLEDYKRSTWWREESDKNFKIQKWVKNQETIDKLQKLQKEGVLDDKVDIRNVSQGIELLLETIYQLTANVDNDTVCDDQLQILQETLADIEKNNQRNTTPAPFSQVLEEQTLRSSSTSERSLEISLLGLNAKAPVARRSGPFLQVDTLQKNDVSSNHEEKDINQQEKMAEKRMSFGDKAQLMDLQEFESPLTLKNNKLLLDESNMIEPTSFAESVAIELRAPEHGDKVSQLIAQQNQKTNEALQNPLAQQSPLEAAAHAATMPRVPPSPAGSASPFNALAFANDEQGEQAFQGIDDGRGQNRPFEAPESMINAEVKTNQSRINESVITNTNNLFEGKFEKQPSYDH